MKQLRNILIVIVALLITSSAHAQNNPLSLGGMFGIDQKRLEVAPSVSFGVGIYNCMPPTYGFEGTGLIGLFSSSLGQYPAANKGMWIKTEVNPFGFTNLEGIDRAKVNNPALGRHEDWQALAKEPSGSFTASYQLDTVGVINFVYRLRHRDGRDRYTFLFITATWRRGDNLPAKLEMMVRPEIPGCTSMQAKDILPYLSGFQPAYGPISGGSTQSSTQVIPGQSSTATADPMQGQGGGLPPTGGGFPALNPPTGGQGGSYQQPIPFGVTIGARHSDPVTAETVGQVTGFYSVAEPAGANGSSTTTIPLNLNRPTMVVRCESAQPFTVEIRLRDGNVSQAKVERTQSGYVCLVFGRTASFLDKGIQLVIAQQGRTRTIKFQEGN